MRRALWHLLCAAAAARAFPRRAEILQNFGVVSRPAAGKKTRPETRPATLRRLRGEGVQRTRLFAYGAKDIEDAATALGPGAKVAVSVPDAEVEAVGRDYADAKRICATIAPAVRAGVVDLIFVGVEPPSGIGADVGRLASLANASRTIAAACAAANATVPVTVAYNLNCLRSSYAPPAPKSLDEARPSFGSRGVGTRRSPSCSCRRDVGRSARHPLVSQVPAVRVALRRARAAARDPRASARDRCALCDPARPAPRLVFRPRGICLRRESRRRRGREQSVEETRRRRGR